MSTDAPMPIMAPMNHAELAQRRLLRLPEAVLPLPWAVIAPHRQQALVNHGQTLERLRERGGLSACEAVAIIEGRRWHQMDMAEAFTRLAELTRAATEGERR